MDNNNNSRLTALGLGLYPVSRYQKGKTNLDILEQGTVSGNGICWAICKSASRPRQITTPAPYHSDRSYVNIKNHGLGQYGAELRYSTLPFCQLCDSLKGYVLAVRLIRRQCRGVCRHAQVLMRSARLLCHRRQSSACSFQTASSSEALPTT